jgi:hypothetical protein
MAAADNWSHTGEDDSNTMEESSGSESEEERAKRARVSPTRGPPRAIPDDVLDAIIKLRVTNESAFVSAADGRSRNSRGKIWERMSEKLLSDFGNRKDVPESALQPRQLGKRWAYIEKNFKVTCACIVCDLSRSYFHVCIHVLAAVPVFSTTKRSWTQGTTFVCEAQGCTGVPPPVLPCRSP